MTSPRGGPMTDCQKASPIFGQRARGPFRWFQKAAIVDGQMGAPDAAIESMVTDLVVEYSLSAPFGAPHPTGALTA